MGSMDVLRGFCPLRESLPSSPIAFFFSLFFLSTVLGLPGKLPHCSDSSYLQGQMNNDSSTMLALSLHDTGCLQIGSMNGSTPTLHTVSYVSLLQSHPVTSSYEFGVPRIHVACICDCAGADAHCVQRDYEWKNCSTGDVCYRTYFPSQDSTGCPTGAKAEGCCQIQIEPSQDIRYKALSIGKPDTTVLLNYKMFENIHGTWRLVFSQDITAPLNSGAARWDSPGKFELSVYGGKPSRELTEGVYFTSHGSQKLKQERTNELGEAALDRLGWFRFENGKWMVPNGLLKFTTAHRLKILDCKAQKYLSSLDAQFYEDDSHKFSLNQIDDVTSLPFVESTLVTDRAVQVTHREGVPLMIFLRTKIRPFIVEHHSQLGSFEGQIQVDANSHRILNVTFYETKGTLIGKLYTSEAKTDSDFVYSVSTDSSALHSFRSTASVGALVDGRRFVCFHPSGKQNEEKCKWLPFISTPLATPPSTRDALPQTGICLGCNEFGVTSVLAAVDPRNWLDGVNSAAEGLGILLDAVVVVVLVIAIVMLCTKCLFPLVRCIFFVPSFPSKK